MAGIYLPTFTSWINLLAMAVLKSLSFIAQSSSISSTLFPTFFFKVEKRASSACWSKNTPPFIAMAETPLSGKNSVTGAVALFSFVAMSIEIF
jgi:hypothetical protein